MLEQMEADNEAATDNFFKQLEQKHQNSQTFHHDRRLNKLPAQAVEVRARRQASSRELLSPISLENAKDKE